MDTTIHRTLSPVKAGMVLATFLGAWHLLWALLVAVGWAQPVIDFVFWIHLIRPVYVIEPFHAAIAALLVVITAAIGFVVGYVFAALWNWLHV